MQTEIAAKPKFKAGAKINFIGKSADLRSDRREPATIARTTRQMLPLPTDYLPVRFADGGVLLVHASAIEARA